MPSTPSAIAGVESTPLLAIHAAVNLRSDPIPGLIRQLAVPASLGMLFSVLLNVVDTYYAGWLSPSALAALSLAGPGYFVMITLGIGAGQATNALVGGRLGAEQPVEARKLAMQCLSFAFLVSAVASVVAFFFTPALFIVMGGEDPYLQPAILYMRISLFSTALFSLAVVLNALLNTQGDTHSYRNAQLYAVLANIVLDPLFMFTFGLGVAGVAVVSVLLQVGVVVYLSRKVMKLDFMQAPKQSEFKVLLLVIGLNIAALSLTSVNYGANQMERVQEIYSTAMRYALILTVAGGVVILIGAKLVMALFTSDAEVQQIGVTYLYYEAFIFPAYAITFLCASVLQGLKLPKISMYFNIVRQVIGQLILFYIAVHILKLDVTGIWGSVLVLNWVLAIAIAWVTTNRVKRTVAPI